MTLYVLYHNERFLIEPENPIWQHYAEIAFWLVPHAVAGTSALLAPLQFFERLRVTPAHHIVDAFHDGALCWRRWRWTALPRAAARASSRPGAGRGDADDNDPRRILAIRRRSHSTVTDDAKHAVAPVLRGVCWEGCFVSTAT
jgi:hypothetical protein